METLHCSNTCGPPQRLAECKGSRRQKASPKRKRKEKTERHLGHRSFSSYTARKPLKVRSKSLS
eukprot:scaffold156166_cov26-Prasinocladus_malaysianus.AAC.1